MLRASPPPVSLLFCALLVWATLGAAPARQSLPTTTVLTGEIHGSVVVQRRAARLAVNRYPGAAGGNQPHALAPIPAVAFLSGPGLARRTGGAARMAQRDTTFAPPLLVVPVGTRVSFPNEDPFFHNVFSYSRPKRFDLGRYPRGESRSVVFDQPGAVKLFCEVHRWMRAAVIVVENPFHAVIAEDGSFRIPDVPAGRYTLTLWDFDRGEVQRPVEVPPQGRVNVQIAL